MAGTVYNILRQSVMQIIYATKSSFTIENMLPWYFEKMTVLLRKLYEKLFSYDKEVLCCVSFFAYIVYIYLMKLPPRPRSSRVHPPTRQSQSPPEPRPLAPSSHRCPRREMVRPPCSCHLHRPCSKCVMRGDLPPQQRGWPPPTTQRNPRPHAT